MIDVQQGDTDGATVACFNLPLVSRTQMLVFTGLF